MYVQRNTEARSRNHECPCVSACVDVGALARACACVRVALIIQHATQMLHINCSLSSSTTLFDVVIKDAIFGKNLLSIKSVF
jgi:hypothetical protein